jgi:hypothetical protein
MNLKTRVTVLFCMAVSSMAYAQNNLRLWYEKPAKEWVEALPVGNGRIGAMIFGGVENELIQLNEGTLWSGGPQKKNINPDAPKYLQPIRDALAKEDYKTATALCRKMQGYFSESFLPMGDLEIKQSFKTGGSANNYYRDLNLSNATASTRFEIKGVQYTREIFSTAADSVLIIRITASKQEMISLDLTLKSRIESKVVPAGNDQLILSGTAPIRLDPSYYNKPGRNPLLQKDSLGHTGMRFQSILKVVPEAGNVTADNDGIHVKEANAVTIYLAAATSYNGMFKFPDTQGKDEKTIAQRQLKSALAKSYDDLKNRHISDYKKYFDRVSFTLTDTTNNQVNDKLPSDFRLKLYSYGNYDPGLEQLFYQYGRYLLISSSRPGGTPANLQGIWNKEFRAPWSSNYTININTEMNYWPAEVTNLSEMHTPLLKWIQNLSVNGKETAKEFYKARGWVAHHNSDIWGMTNPVGNKGDGDPQWANWYMGANWLSQHLWEHYAYTGDKEFLRKEAYPVMKEAALFCFDWLVEKDGYLITSPSNSPENVFVTGKNEKYSMTEGSYMDIEIIRDLFTNVIEASEALNMDKDFRQQVIAKRNKLLPYRIGSRGQLQEWMRDYQEEDPHHRHTSHLFGLHPGRDISPLKTPELAQAANRTFELRGDGGTGWSKGWKINFAARLLDGDHAYKMIREILNYVDPAKGGADGTYPNFFDAHPPFQIDGNFAATAGISEMLLQSHLGEIHLLPALPKAWPAGEISGLKARGNFEVNISWSNHKLAKATVQSVKGNQQCTIRTEIPVEISGVASKQSTDGKYFLNTFNTKPGVTYEIRPAKN